MQPNCYKQVQFSFNQLDSNIFVLLLATVWQGKNLQKEDEVLYTITTMLQPVTLFHMKKDRNYSTNLIYLNKHILRIIVRYHDMSSDTTTCRKLFSRKRVRKSETSFFRKENTCSGFSSIRILSVVLTADYFQISSIEIMHIITLFSNIRIYSFRMNKFLVSSEYFSCIFPGDDYF